MKKSELLKKAKKLLWNGKSLDRYYNSDDNEYICFAVRAAANWDATTPEGLQSLQIVEWIEELIGLGYSQPLELWLANHHPYFPRDDRRKMQQLRHKWINWMIHYWEAREAADAQCTLCAKVESPGFYTGCMINDGACTNSGYTCDGNGNLKREVNMQNIPIGTEEGNRIREAFISQIDNTADYSQIELRILAHVSGSEQP